MTRVNCSRMIATPIAFLVVSLLTWSRGMGQQNGTYDETQVAKMTKLGFAFQGPPTCSDPTKCHGAVQPNPDLKIAGNEVTRWRGNDPHRTAYKKLQDPKSDEIAKRLNIADPTTSDKCLGCHAVNAPKGPPDLQGKDFNIRDGVSCDACHGPSEKWCDEHAKQGWMDQQRKALPAPADRLKKWGFNDNKDLMVRAETCTGCHLKIDAAMVEAKHPQPRFDLVYFSNSPPSLYKDRHWRQPDGFALVNMWAIGQTVCLRESMKQLAQRASDGATKDEMLKDAYDQAMSHYWVFHYYDGSLDAQGKAVEEAMAAKDKGKLAGAALALATAAEQIAKPADADKARTLQLLSKIASDPTMASKFGGHGMSQQGYAILALYDAYATASGPLDQTKKDILIAIVRKLVPAKDQTLSEKEFEDTLNQIKAKLPTQ